MKKLFIPALISIGLLGCQQIGGLFKRDSNQYSDVQEGPRPYKNTSIIANEFNFKGDPAVVTSWMQDNGLSVSFQKIFDDSNFYNARYEGANFIAYEQVELGLKDKVEVIEPNQIVTLEATSNVYEWPNDKHFFRQYGLNNIGQSAPYGLPGVKGADIDLLKAWNEGHKGSDDIIVAVIDTGVDYKHPDLVENMWFNEAERNGNPGADEDGNEFYDDEYGFDFYSADRRSLHYGKLGDPDPMDDQGHGTHCAGVIGAVSNNGIGVAGVNWNVSIMPIRFLGQGGGTDSDGARSIEYAVKNGAHIISASWGSKSKSELTRTAIARANEAGVLFVAAAGNSSENNDIDSSAHYPSSYDLPNVISVGASDNQDAPAEFSNYGHESVDVFAPGVLTFSTYPTELAKEKGSEPYMVMSGTSMATPHVAGVAALLMASRPELIGQPEMVKNLLIATSDVKPQLVGKSRSNGRINVYSALTAPLDSDVISPEWTEKPHTIDHVAFNEELFDIRDKIVVPEAKAIRVHFDFIDIEEPYDSIYLYDKDQRLITQVESIKSASRWSAVIPGNEVMIRYVNSKVKAPKKSVEFKATRESCYQVGGLTPIPMADGKFGCDVDSKGSGDSDIFNTFVSQGYRVDKIQYLPL